MPTRTVAPLANAATVSEGPRVAAPVAGGSTRFANATQRDLALVPKVRGSGTVPAIIFFATIGLLLIGGGIALVIVGDDNDIVDLIVFGGICLFMGVVNAVVGAFFVVRPILKERRLQVFRMALERTEQNPGPVNI